MKRAIAAVCLAVLCAGAASALAVNEPPITRSVSVPVNASLKVANALAAPSAVASAAPAAVSSTDHAPLSYAATQQAAQQQNLVSVVFRDSPIQEVFQMLARSERVNILLRKGVTGNVSVSLYDVTVPKAIQSIAEAGGYAVEHPRPGEYLITERKDAALESTRGDTRVRSYKVQYSNPRSVAEILAKHLSRHGKITPLLERNLLVVEDLPEFHVRVDAILKEIDVEPVQIMIEAKILEITLDERETFGIDWNQVFGSGRASAIGTQGLSTRGTPGFFFSVVNQNLNLYLNALSSKGRVHTLSTPKLLALENQQATVVIGDRIGYKVTTTINLVTTESVQFLDTGVILRVVPSIDQRGLILLKIHPEVSSGSISDGVPSKKSTEVTTQLLAEDGQSILIGGLIKNNASRRRNGVPTLGDVPVLGWLFSNREEAALSSETVVMITPRVMRRNSPEAAGAVPERIQRMEELIFRPPARQLADPGETDVPAGEKAP